MEWLVRVRGKNDGTMRSPGNQDDENKRAKEVSKLKSFERKAANASAMKSAAKLRNVRDFSFLMRPDPIVLKEYLFFGDILVQKVIYAMSRKHFPRGVGLTASPKISTEFNLIIALSSAH
ncbi:hypothetical protein KIN20_016220 [Parelaphostrongylus tenuis]|uniref:Uncharacterized protein n=1 Tax=Parelaphostrongylus tenuis TaxID=148309 RepID=A0AAD5N513_PARTN|nr:hypothetical protein KIN20_016220 [Parelaphostrongylus tenuis]